MSAPEVWAALRDASWYNSPGTALQYHVVLEGDGWYAACSPPKPNRWPRMLLVDFTVRPAAEITDIARCGRPGCRQRWPEPAAASVSRGTVTG